MAEKSGPSAVARSLRHHAIVAFLVVGVLLGGLGTWAALTEVDGAVMAGGVVVVEGGSRKVQHQEGGIVRRILVKNGDRVAVGQVLLQLDGTSVEASLAVIEGQLDEMLARKARLLAEASGAGLLPTVSAAGWMPTEGFSIAVQQQQDLMLARRAANVRQSERLAEQRHQLSAQLKGVSGQRQAANSQMAILTEEWAGLSELLDDGLTSSARTNTNKSQRVQLEGELARLETEAAAIQAAIAEKDMAIAQLRDDTQAKALEDLQDVAANIAELLQQRIAARDRLARLDVRAPVAGTVHESKVQTVGGVLAPAEPLMVIIPYAADVLVDAHVSPMDIDKVSRGQAVYVRLLSFDSRTAPDLEARVVDVSPSTSTDPSTGVTFYTVRIDVEDEAIPQQERQRIVPGMPAEAFVETGTRTVMSYLMKPLMDQIGHTFRED